MPDFSKNYISKRMTPETAAACLRSDSDISMGMALGEPPALIEAIAARVSAGELHDLRLWYFHSMPHAGETLLTYENMDRVQPHCMFLGAVERELFRRGEADNRQVIHFVPTAFSEAPRLLSERVALDTFICTVSPMDRHGWFSFGTNNDYASRAARSAKRLIVEVNANMPRTFGNSMLHVSEVDMIVEHDTPLFEVPERPLTPEDDRIAEIIADMIPDGGCIQMGIGGLPNAICRRLKNHKDLGVHTELLSPGIVDLIEAGVVNNRRKKTHTGRTVFTFAMGHRRMYDLLHDNPSISSLPVDEVNDPRHIAKNDQVISVNATLQIDFTGACNSEHMMGRQYSGSGGQLDFVRGAAASNGGRSIIACHSTAKDGTVSRIVPDLDGPVTTPRNDVDTVVTEYGSAELKGLSTSERARALIGIAHPDFRDELTQAARRLVLL